MSPRYKVVETQVVTDEVLEDLINCWTGKGWHLEGVQFAMRDASRRPSMAFILFTREGGAPEEGEINGSES